MSTLYQQVSRGSIEKMDKKVLPPLQGRYNMKHNTKEMKIEMKYVVLIKGEEKSKGK